VHQLRREAGRGPERGKPLPRPRPVAGLLLELAARRDLGVLDLAGRRIDVERPGRNLEQHAAGRQPELADHEDAIGVVDREHRHGAGMPDDVTLAARAVGPLDRVDAELHVVALVDHPRIDDALGEVGGIDRARQ
jgi:hypothetical protein